nr:zonadhesin-like protein 8 [Plectrocnemia conspersa]
MKKYIILLCTFAHLAQGQSCELKCSKKREVLNIRPGPCVPGVITTCSEHLRGKADVCRRGTNTKLAPRCDCVEGYLRRSDGECVRPDKCCPGDNQTVVNNPSACPITCINMDTYATTPCARMPLTRGCTCKNGYVRDANFNCILPKDCPPRLVCIKPNEVLNPCPGACVPGVMSYCYEYTSGIPNECVPPTEPLPCEPRCDCIQGYLRNDLGECVLQEDCCPGDNQTVVNNPSACPITCINMDTHATTPCARMPLTRGCTCKNGYVRDANFNCILPKDCPPRLVCIKPNEVLNPCPGACVPGVMSYCYEYTSGIPNECVPPTEPLPCEPRCDCIQGYLRNDLGECVLQEDCCPGPNQEMVDCPDPCPLSCDNLATHGSFPCGRMCIRRGCACRSGFVRDANNVCIAPSECPIVCGENEIYSCLPCPRGMLCTEICKKGCVCKDGFIRNTEGRCVEVLQCKKNEEFNPCIRYCTFDDDCAKILLGIIRDCAAPPDDVQCTSGCQCKAGFVRIGENCVTPDKCCEGPDTPNQVMVTCPSPCDDTCDKKAPVGCELSPCNRIGCRCKMNYVRDANGKCILKKNCRKCPDCQQNIFA